MQAAHPGEGPLRSIAGHEEEPQGVVIAEICNGAIEVCEESVALGDHLLGPRRRRNPSGPLPGAAAGARPAAMASLAQRFNPKRARKLPPTPRLAAKAAWPHGHTMSKKVGVIAKSGADVRPKQRNPSHLRETGRLPPPGRYYTKVTWGPPMR